MDLLPPELHREILSHCSLPILKCLRLTSRSWAVLGEEYLISPTFTTFLHHPDFQRLLDVSQHPFFSQKIEALLINLAEINEYHAKHNSYFVEYVRDPIDRVAAQESTWVAYAEIKERKEVYMPHACTPDILYPALKNLPNLKRVQVSLAKCPFQEEDEKMGLLREVWNIPSTRLMPRVATTERFTSLICAISRSPSTVTDLSHDQLPFEFFAQKATKIMSLVSVAFIPLRELDLVLDYSDMPNNHHSSLAFKNLSHSLRSASRLRTLRLCFQGRKKIDIGPLLNSFVDHGFIFKELGELKLEGVKCIEDELVRLLIGHSCNLKKVQLGGIGVKAPHQQVNGGIHLKEGTWKSVFDDVVDGLKLDSFLAQGDMVEIVGGKHCVLREVESVESLGELAGD